MTDPALTTKTKALIWEELRVGGVISATCTFFVALSLLWFRVQLGEDYFKSELFFIAVIILAGPLLIALLLILNPDHKGSMKLGFSTRILELPVPTFLPVTISFWMRILSLTLATVAAIAISRLVLTYQLSYAAALPVIGFYALMQAFDWARTPLSGLSSAIVSIIGIFAVWYLVASESYRFNRFSDWILEDSQANPIQYGATVIGLVFMSYGLSLFTVRAARIGRRYGIPEIWEWHKHLDLGSSRMRNPFRSPIAAQAWRETRRSFYLLPIVAVLWTIAFYVGIWIDATQFTELDEGLTRATNQYVWGAFVPFAGILVGAIAHGLTKGILWYRSAKGLPGFHYLQPLTTSQMAHARMLSNAMLLLPLLVLANIVHFAWPQSGFITEYIPEALSIGVTSVHEVIWVLTGRMLLIGLVAWSLMAILTRIGGLIILLSVTVVPAIIGLLYVNGIYGIHGTITTQLSLSTLLIVCCVIAFVRVWRLHLVSTFTLAGWMFLTFMTAYLIHGQAALAMASIAPNPLWYMTGVWMCLAIASLLPLPFLATLLDLHRRRHSKTPTLTPHSQSRVMSPKRLSLAVAAVLVVLWLGYPKRPAYEVAYRAQGLPATLEDLNNYYAAVPDDENIALEYLRLIEIQQEKQKEYEEIIEGGLPEPSTPEEEYDQPHYSDNVLIHDKNFEPGKTIPDEVIVASNKYWKNITSHIAPEIRALAQRENPKCRYPIDLRESFSTLLDHLSPQRQLARDMSLDSWYWSTHSDAQTALDSLLAINTIADSLYQEPLYISVLTGKAISGIARGNAQTLLNNIQLTDSQLKLLSDELLKQENQFETALDNALIGERTMIMSLTDIFAYSGVSTDERAMGTLIIPISSLTMPIASERIVFSIEVQRALGGIAIDPSEIISAKRAADDRLFSLFFIAPMSTISSPSLLNTNWEPQRTYTTVTLTGIAVERFRIANNRLPNSLDDLVPTYLDEIPPDYFNESGATLNYRLRDEGGFVVYSVGRNGEDDNGELRSEDNRNDDITFTITR